MHIGIIIYVIYIFLKFVGLKLPYDTLNEVRDRLTDVCPSITRYGDLEQANYFTQASNLAKVIIYTIQYFIYFIYIIFLL